MQVLAPHRQQNSSFQARVLLVFCASHPAVLLGYKRQLQQGLLLPPTSPLAAAAKEALNDLIAAYNSNNSEEALRAIEQQLITMSLDDVAWLSTAALPLVVSWLVANDFQACSCSHTPRLLSIASSSEYCCSLFPSR